MREATVPEGPEHRPGASSPGGNGVPDWVHGLGVAVWVSDPQQRMTFVNARAERLLHVRSEDCLGRHCYEVIAAEDPRGRTFCRGSCPLVGAARAQRPLRPVRVAVGGEGSFRRWLQVLVIPVQESLGGPSLVHAAQEADQVHRMEQYLQRVASRHRRKPASPRRSLTRREVEVLEHLARDWNLDETAAALGIRRVTVRNHVQHILAKLGAHSIQEAVARYVLDLPDVREPDRGHGKGPDGSGGGSPDGGRAQPAP